MKSLALCLLLAGCVTLSAEERQYAIDVRQVRTLDRILLKIKNCDTFVTYVGNATSIERRRMQRDRLYIPRNAKTHDFVCGWPEML